MKLGDFLVDVTRNESRFQLDRLLTAGDTYQIAIAKDAATDNKEVCIKTIAYDPARTRDKKYVASMRKMLRDELEFLACTNHLIPEPLDWLQLENSDTVIGREPVLVYEYIHGQSLYDLVREKYPNGMNPNRALRIVRELALFLSDIHSQRYVFLDLNPRHVVIGFDDIVHVVGCGNAAPFDTPHSGEREKQDTTYIAPEARSEKSGRMHRPRADVYTLGALLSFLMTGEEPRGSVENPLTAAAFRTLSQSVDPGIALLIARCIRPMAKERFAKIVDIIPFLDGSTLPTATTPGFGLLQLPAPWSGAESPSERTIRNRLTPGPLMSSQKPATPVAPAAVQVQEHQETALQKPAKKKRKGCMGWTISFSLVPILTALLFAFW